MAGKKNSSVAAGAVIFTIGMFCSRLIGLIRDNRLNNIFGDSDVAGAYRLAFTIPDLFYFLLAGGALSAAFIPVFTSYLARNQKEEANRIASSVFTLLLLVISFCTIVIVIFAPQFVKLLPAYRHMQPEIYHLTVKLVRIMCFMLIFTAQSALFTGILNSFKHFLAPVIVWNTYNLAILFGITIFSKMAIFGGTPSEPNIVGVAYGVLLGAISLAVIQLPFAWHYGFRPRLVIELAHEGVQRIFQLFLPVMASLSLSQFNLLTMPLWIGSYFGPPAVANIGNANKIVMLPFSLFAMAISTAVFPTLSQQIAIGEFRAFRDTLNRSITLLLLLSIPSAMGMMILAEPIVALLWGGGKLGLQGIQASGFVLVLFAWGVIGLGLAQIVNRAFYSMQDTKTPTIISIGMVVGNLLLSMLFSLYTPLKYGGVALATTITVTFSTLILIQILRKRLNGIGGRILSINVGKILLASAAMGIVCYLIAVWLAPDIAGHSLLPTIKFIAPYLPSTRILGNDNLVFSRLQVLIQVGTAISAGIIVYFVTLHLLGVKESGELLNRFFGKMLSRFNKTR